jgi:hypothetical protein
MKTTVLFWFILTVMMFPLLLTAGCRKPADKNIKELLAAKDTVSIGQTQLKLESYLWRDFMPTSPPDGKPMRAAVTLVPVNAEKIPAEVDLVKLWVISDQTVWSTELQQVGSPDTTKSQPKIEKTASDGPKWGPGITVTVLAQIKDPQGNYHLIKADNQMIHRTE